MFHCSTAIENLVDFWEKYEFLSSKMDCTMFLKMGRKELVCLLNLLNVLLDSKGGGGLCPIQRFLDGQEHLEIRIVWPLPNSYLIICCLPST